MTKKYQFLVVTIRFQSVQSQQIRNNLEKTFNNAKDWLRFSTGVYFLFTSRSPQTWYERIRNTPGMPSSYSALIAPVNLAHRSGQNTRRVWDWIKKNIASQQ